MDSRHAHQGVEGSHQFRHCRHGNVLGRVGTDAAADCDGKNDQNPGSSRPDAHQQKRGYHRDSHADHTEPVSLSG